MNLFDVSIYPREVHKGYCYCCGEHICILPKPLTAYMSANKAFKRITGRAWTKGCGLSLNLHADLTTLGIDCSKAPSRCSLCLACSVDYMTEFNKRNEER